MKLHPPLMNGIAHALKLIFQEGKYADKVIEQLLKSDKRWGSRDRAFLAENTYEIVRWWRLLWALAGEEPSFETERLVRLIGVNLVYKNTLHISSPPLRGGAGGENSLLPEWEEFKGLDISSLVKKRNQITLHRKIIQSIPDWLDETGEAELGEAWPAELAALNQPAEVALRANRLKTTPQELKKMLAAEGLKTRKTGLSPDGLVLEKRGNILQSPLFKKGMFEVQDAGSQCIAPFLRPEPGMRVIDACAGAGGKSLHLAALMENKGSIIALDTEAWKLEELKKRARRNGVHIIQARLIESSKTIKRLHNSADRLLLDVPCSGIGTLRRNPDAKWKLSPEFLQQVKATQADILDRYSPMLKPGGLMVYATCSILPSENERQVERFLASHPEFKLVDERKISPAKDGFDGFYMAALGLGSGDW